MRTIKKENKGFWITEDELTAIFVVDLDEVKAGDKSKKINTIKTKLKEINSKINLMSKTIT